jgi:hypothetical protein
MSIERVTGLDKDNLGLDEVVASDCFFHAERMSASLFWFMAEADGKAVRVFLRAVRGRLLATVEQDQSLPQESKP